MVTYKRTHHTEQWIAKIPKKNLLCVNSRYEIYHQTLAGVFEKLIIVTHWQWFREDPRRKQYKENDNQYIKQQRQITPQVERQDSAFLPFEIYQVMPNIEKELVGWIL